MPPLPTPPLAGPSAAPLEDDPRRLAEALFAAVLPELSPRLPRATYRVQLGRDFPFEAARAVVDYLDALGVSDLYASPCFKARPESSHGYDVVDHTAFNPAIGTREDFERLTDRLAARGMGLLLDTVPNHMGIGGPNPWWRDVLENGPSSIYSAFFDIAWRPLHPALDNRVLLPVLGDHYGRVLERGELRIERDGGAFSARYFDQEFPLSPRTYRLILEPMLPALAERLGEEHDAVLELQSVLTGLDHLPPRGETRRPRMVERRREKEILKRRSPPSSTSRSSRGPSRSGWSRSTGAWASRAASTSWTRCSRRRPSAWPTSASPPRRSTTGASSTSTTWWRCASRTRWCSRPRTGCCSSWWARGG